MDGKCCADLNSSAYYDVLHKGLQHPQILVSEVRGVLEIFPHGYQGTTVLTFVKEWQITKLHLPSMTQPSAAEQ